MKNCFKELPEAEYSFTFVLHIELALMALHVMHNRMRLPTMMTLSKHIKSICRAVMHNKGATELMMFL